MRTFFPVSPGLSFVMYQEAIMFSPARET